MTNTEINKRVAEKVFGIPGREVRARGGTFVVLCHTTNPACRDGQWTVNELHNYFLAPNYCESIADAWSVVEKMQERSHQIEVTWVADRGVSQTWTNSKGKKFIGAPDLNPNPKPFYNCVIMGKSQQFAQCWEGLFSVRDESAPRGICLVALKALESMPKEKTNAPAE